MGRFFRFKAVCAVPLFLLAVSSDGIERMIGLNS